MKNNKGITLIALVITIIVLLILAGVSIAMLTGENGILTQAENAKTDTSDAELADRINMALNGEFTNLLADGYLSGGEKTAGTVTTVGVVADIKAANGLDEEGMNFNVSIGAIQDTTAVLKITADGSGEGTEDISGVIKYDSTNKRYVIDSANYPQ